MKYFFPLVLIFFYGSSFAQHNGKVYLKENVDSIIYDYIISHDLPSAAVGIVYHDSVLYEKRITTDEITNDQSKSIYNIASVAKPFVATAILLLTQEGKLDIKAPVVRYLPEFKLNSKFTDKITIEHLLTHTSGLPNTSSPDDYQYFDVDITDTALSDHIRSLSALKLEFKPGKKYSYSNVGFEVLGQIIATVSGMPFHVYMTTKLFSPLQMERTSYLLPAFAKDEIAAPHDGHPRKITDKFPYNRAFSPSGNLFTAIDDINKWMIFNLNEGKYKHFQPLVSEYFNKLSAPRVATDEDDFIGLSWFTKGGLIFHDGLDLGYSALMILYKKPKIGVSVLINHQDADCNELLNIIAKTIKY